MIFSLMITMLDFSSFAFAFVEGFHLNKHPFVVKSKETWGYMPFTKKIGVMSSMNNMELIPEENSSVNPNLLSVSRVQYGNGERNFY